MPVLFLRFVYIVYRWRKAQASSIRIITFLIHPYRFEVKQEQNYQRGDLKGPRAKNHPDWKYKSSLTVVKHATSPKNRIGPAAKNYHPGRNNQPAQYQMVTKKDKENLKGPRAKNRKPWRN